MDIFVKLDTVQVYTTMRSEHALNIFFNYQRLTHNNNWSSFFFIYSIFMYIRRPKKERVINSGQIIVYGKIIKFKIV